VLPTIPVPPRRLDDYASDAGEDAVERLREAARPLKGLRVLHVNSTAFGGGVAELLQTHVALFDDLGIDTTWAVLEGSDEFFAVTKDVHNGLQGGSVRWTAQMEDVYWDRVRANAAALDEAYDAVIVHDPQPAGLLQVMEEENRREGVWVWRCHIDMSSPSASVWSFFEPLVNGFDAAIFTMEEFCQPGVRRPRLSFVPPSIDPTSSKNVELHRETVNEVLGAYGIDPSRPIVSQVSRFDPWKDPIGVIDAYRLAREAIPDLQLIMAGSMASDDPEGIQFLDLTEEHRGGDSDIHLLTNLQNVGNTEINAFQRASAAVIQKSTREGFGLVVSEGMWKRRPVIGGNVGGIRLQIEDGRSGFLVDTVEQCGARIVQLLEDDALRAAMGDDARQRVRDRFLTTRELDDYCSLLAELR
jgi:trehalose synthase